MLTNFQQPVSDWPEDESSPVNQKDSILIADDNQINLKLLSHYLNRNEYEVITATGGEAAFEMANETLPDLILLDVMMPDIDGFDTCKRLKAHAATQEIPVIIMTSLSDLESKINGFRAGAVDYLTKPFEFGEILARVNTHLTIGKLQRAMQKEIARRETVERALRTSEARYRSIIEDQTDIICRYLPDGQLTFANQAYSYYFDYFVEEDIIGTSVWLHISEEDLPRFQATIADLTPEKPVVTQEYQIINRRGEVRWQQWTNRAIFDEERCLIEYQSVIQDITQRKQAEETYQTIIKFSVQGLTLLQNHRVVLVNSAIERILGYSNDELLSMPADVVMRKFMHSNQGATTDELSAAQGEAVLSQREARIIAKDGAARWVEKSTTLTEYRGESAVQIAVIDITERKKAEFHLRQLANIDGLTRVANRRRFDQYLDEVWSQKAKSSHKLSLILCDIDYFKQYNDTYGHLIGDDCLRQVAEALAMAVNYPNSLVARYGGEEFAVVLPEIDSTAVVDLAQQLQAAIAELKLEHINSKVCPHVTLSMGVATVIPTREESPQHLINKADEALYLAKEQGRNRVVIG